MQFSLTVKGIIRKQDTILVLQRSLGDDHKPGAWETPGGGMDRLESPQEALEREIMEETGLTVRVGDPFHVFTFRKDNGEYKVGITFLCDYVSGAVQLSHEHSAFKWIDPKDFQTLPSIESLYNEIARYAQKYV